MSAAQDGDGADTRSVQSPQGGVKHLYLIRHSESENNVDKREAKAALSTLFQQLPTTKQLGHIRNLLKVEMDSVLSSDGVQMVKIQREVLQKAKFIEENKIDLVLHSHLKRARDTCHVLFGDESIPIKEHELLFEKDLSEYFMVGDIHARAERLRLHLASTIQQENIVLVGHGKFFQAVLGGDDPRHLDNCEVYHCLLHPDGHLNMGRGTIHVGGRSLLDRNDLTVANFSKSNS